MRAKPGLSLIRPIQFRGVLHGALALVLIVLTVVPLVFIVLGSFKPLGLIIGTTWTFNHYIEVWADPVTYKLLGNTLIFTAGSTTLGISIALILAWLLERTDIPAQGLFRAAVIMPMITPPLLLAMGWVLLLSPRIGFVPTFFEAAFGFRPGWMDIYNLPGMIFVMGLAFVPTAFLIFSPVMRNMDPTFEEASRMSGASARETIIHVSRPFLMPSILSTATLFFIVGMLAFDIPAVIGTAGRVHLMSTEIYEMLNGELDLPQYGQAAAMNSVLFVFLLGFLVLYWRMLGNAKRFVTVGGKAFRAARYPLGRWRTPAICFVVTYFLLGILLPFFALVWVSLTPYFTGFDASVFNKLSANAYSQVLGEARFWNAASNAVIIALTASFGAILLALGVSRASINPHGRIGKLVSPLAMLPLGIPHLMLGVALIFMMLNMKFIPLYGTLWIIAIGHTIAYLPVSSRMMHSGMIQLSSELEEAAMISGARLMYRLRTIILPLLAPTFIAIFIWMFVHSIREFSISVILQSGRNEVLSTLLYNYWTNSQANRAAAISTLLMLALLIFAGFFGWIMRDGAKMRLPFSRRRAARHAK